MPEVALQMVDCQRYHALITAQACERYRSRDSVNCAGCSGPGIVVETRPIPVVPITQVKEERLVKNGIKKKAYGKPIRICNGCGQERTITGRGLCHKCYYRAIKGEKPANATGAPAGFPEAERPTMDPDTRCESVAKTVGLGGWFDQVFSGESELSAKLLTEAEKQRRTPLQQLLFNLELFYSVE